MRKEATTLVIGGLTRPQIWRFRPLETIIGFPLISGSNLLSVSNRISVYLRISNLHHLSIAVIVPLLLTAIDVSSLRFVSDFTPEEITKTKLNLYSAAACSYATITHLSARQFH
ncbi:unnamed protein product [Arabis nemorensis]|uniref:Uncharacterized protein n=1 Tax=Arabis nemorensis TaxID=586526 RepID=A0A565CT83_9BRAS|nr:unnamed protein product [Arabis nemorensis]